MRIIDGISYRTKDDLAGKFIGLEQYKPGDPSARDLLIKMTSGTSGTPSMLAVSLKHIFGKSRPIYEEPLLIVQSRNTFMLQWAKLFLEPGARASRLLCLSWRDQEHSDVCRIIEEFQPVHVFSFVSLLRSFLETFNAEGRSRAFSNVRRLYLTGERLTEADIRTFKSFFPNAEIEMGYGISEAPGGVGGHCRYLIEKYPKSLGRAYHPLLPVSIVELDEADVGEIAIRTQELGWYLTGDAGRLVSEPCVCGASQTLFVEGRINYDIVHCVGATVRTDLLEKAFSPLRNFVEEYSVEVREASHEERTVGAIAIAIVPTALLRSRADAEAFIAGEVAKTLQVTKTRTLDDLVRDGIFLPPAVSLVEALSRGNGKKVRLRKVD